MAKRETEVVTSNQVEVIDERTVMKPLTCQPAQIVDDALEVAKIEGLPEEFLGGKFETGFPPSVKFERVGDFIGGAYVMHREGVGPNKSRIYELAIGDGEKALKVVVWGSTVLDRQFDSAYPPIQQGDKVGIVYLGDKKTARNQNPVKLFAFKVVR